MNGLELQTAMEEIEPFRAVNIHSRTKHALREGLRDTQIRRAHREV